EAKVCRKTWKPFARSRGSPAASRASRHRVLYVLRLTGPAAGVVKISDTPPVWTGGCPRMCSASARRPSRAAARRAPCRPSAGRSRASRDQADLPPDVNHPQEINITGREAERLTLAQAEAS